MLILASVSPRRRELLARLGLPFEAVDPNVDEGSPAGRPERLARRLATAKARAVSENHPDATVLAADTVVAYRNILLGKPVDAVEARAMLGLLRLWRTHRVITAVAVLPPGRAVGRPACRPLIDHAVTSVTMRRYSDAEIAASIRRADPFDKAGAYAIQDRRLAPVARYESLSADRRGCYCNVVGLPLWITVRLLGRAGLDITRIREAVMPSQCAECPLRSVRSS